MLSIYIKKLKDGYELSITDSETDECLCWKRIYKEVEIKTNVDLSLLPITAKEIK